MTGAAAPAGGAAGGDAEADRFLSRHGAGLAALAAGLAALPAVGLPFLSDDWALLGSLQRGLELRTPFAYVRPLSTAYLAGDLALFGRSPALVHLSSVALMSAAAAVLVLLIRRLTGDAPLAALAGILFACHPYHIENAAWIAARPDVLSALLAFLALLALLRWCEGAGAVPILAMALFEAALLAKESAVPLPVAALLVGLAAARPPAPARVVRGALALTAVALAHFLVVWPRAAGRSALESVGSPGVHLAGRFADFVAATLIPAATEIIEARPRTWLLAAMLLGALLLAGAWRREGRIPAVAGMSALVYLVLLAPALLSFQARYFYLPSAAASVAVAALLLAMRARWRTALLGLGAVIWAVAGVDHWTSWYEAGRVSRHLVAEVAAIAAEPPGPAHQIPFIVNLPHRIHGAPVFPDLKAVTAIESGKAVPIGYATLIDYASAGAEGLDRSVEAPITRLPDGLEVALAVSDGLRAGLVWPTAGEIPSDAPGRLRVRVPASLAAPENVWYWSQGHLHRADESAVNPR